MKNKVINRDLKAMNSNFQKSEKNWVNSFLSQMRLFCTKKKSGETPDNSSRNRADELVSNKTVSALLALGAVTGTTIATSSITHADEQAIYENESADEEVIVGADHIVISPTQVEGELGSLENPGAIEVIDISETSDDEFNSEEIISESVSLSTSESASLSTFESESTSVSSSLETVSSEVDSVSYDSQSRTDFSATSDNKGDLSEYSSEEIMSDEEVVQSENIETNIEVVAKQAISLVNKTGEVATQVATVAIIATEEETATLNAVLGDKAVATAVASNDSLSTYEEFSASEVSSEAQTTAYTTGISYGVYYVDAETGETVARVSKSQVVTTTDKVAKAEITVTADVPSGYVLAEGQEDTLIQVIQRGSRNEVVFNVFKA